MIIIHHTSNFLFPPIMWPPTCKMCQPQQADFCAACPAPTAESWLILMVVGCNKKTSRNIRIVRKGDKRFGDMEL